MAALADEATQLRRHVMRELSWDTIIRERLEPLLNRG
jgi:hypothetical protein